MKTHTHTLPLPPELIREILLSLPVNSLLQCKRVCKAWLSLISDPQFFISHYILGSCRGLILLYYDRSCDLILWNPSIGVHRISPKFKCGLTLVYLYGFGFYPLIPSMRLFIGWFSLRRRFSEIPLFDHSTMEKYELCSLRVMGGCLSVCCSVRGCATDEIWAMKEYKVDSSWTKSIVIPNNGFSPICITKDGGIIGSKEVED
ncbi:hypothetical protein AAZX31_08G246000 [Glycine max]